MATLPITSKICKKYSLFWIDGSKENLEIPQQLQSIIDHIRICNPVDECEQIIRLLDEDYFILITNRFDSKDIVPRIHDLAQLFSIYIFDIDQLEQQEWIKNYSKIRAIVSEIDILFARIQLANIKFVYRAQLMTIEEFDNLQKSVGDLISMNSFFSTSLDRPYTLFLLGDPVADHGMKRILFQIKADSRLTNLKPFVDITTQSYFDMEQEVLFMLGSIFRIESIQDDVRSSETIFDSCSRGLGSIFEIRGDYDRSLKWYQTTLNFWQNLLSPNHEAIGHAHISIGGIYKRTKQFEKARESFNSALHVWRKAYRKELRRSIILSSGSIDPMRKASS